MRKTRALLPFLTILICVLSIAYGFAEARASQAVSYQLSAVSKKKSIDKANVQVVPIASAKLKEIKEKASHASSNPPVHVPIEVREEIEPKVIDPILPVINQRDIRPQDRPLLDKTLKWLPEICRDNLENLVVRYKPKAQRGQATASTILIRGEMSEQETISIMTHECGHIADLGGLNGSSRAGKSIYPDGPTATYNDDPSVSFYSISWQNSTKRKSGSMNADFVSGYSKSDPFEDFAESFILYALHNNAFKNMANQNDALMSKYIFMRDVVFGESFTPLSSSYAGSEDRVWDVTKLDHKLSL